jgi:hypothetical protein
MLTPRSMCQQLAAAATQLRWTGGKRRPQRVHAVVLEALATASAVSWRPRLPAIARITSSSGPSGHAALHRPRHRCRSLRLGTLRRSPRQEEENERNGGRGIRSATPPLHRMPDIWTGTVATCLLGLERLHEAPPPVTRLEAGDCAKATLVDWPRDTSRVGCEVDGALGSVEAPP